jgi:Tfp pilus assembly protein PilE
MTRTRTRTGFTLFQLLIIIAILALLLALFLPATVQLRIAAARTQSQNNLKQMGIAIHAYHDTNGVMPPGVGKTGFSTHAYILPYIEQAALYNQIDFAKAPDDKANATVRNARIKIFLSPMDNAPMMNDAGPTNYLFSAGSKADLKNNDGVFYADSKTRITDITDGTSNTMMIGETLRGDGGVRAMTVLRQHVELKADALKGIKPDAGVEDWKNDKNIVADRGAVWLEGKFLYGTFTATLRLNDQKPDVNCAGLGGISALRTPIQTVQVAVCDGSVRSLGLGLSMETWQAFATRAGGEVLGSDF